MSVTFKFKRGNYANLPLLTEGEPAFCLDTKQLFIGDGAENHAIVMENQYGDDSVLYAPTAGNPESKTLAELFSLMSGKVSADFSMNSFKITNLADPVNDQDAATKAWVLANLASTAINFLDLTDTPSAYTADYVVKVNGTGDGLEFVNFATTWLENAPTDGELNKAPTSNWAFDHNAANSNVHGCPANEVLLHSGSTIDAGTF